LPVLEQSQEFKCYKWNAKRFGQTINLDRTTQANFFVLELEGDLLAHHRYNFGRKPNLGVRAKFGFYLVRFAI